MNPQDAEPTPKEAPEPSGPPPASRAVPPDSSPPAAAELIDDIDAYQKRIEREWESAKTIYQSRISEIMDDFLKKGAGEAPANGHSPSQKKAAASAPDTMETLVSRVANELRAMDSRTRHGVGAPERLALPAPAARPRLWRKIIAPLLASTLILAAVIGLRMPEWTPLPYARTGAIAVVGGKIYVADWFRKTLYTHAAKRGAPILAVEPLPVGLIAGLQPKGDDLWTIDGLSHEILRHAMTSDHQITERFPAPDAKPAGLVFDHEDLWVAGLESKTLFRLRADDPTDVRDRLDFPVTTVTAMQMQNKRLWVLDGKARELTVFRLQKPLKALATFDLDPFLRGATPTGLSLSGATAWIVTENPSAIVRVSLSRIKKSKSSEF